VALGDPTGALAGVIGQVGAVAVSGFASGAISSGDLKGGVQGAFSAMVFYGIGQAANGLQAADANSAFQMAGGAEEAREIAMAGNSSIWSNGGIGRAAMHAAGGCITAVAGGGNCGRGALTAGVGKAITGNLSDVDDMVVGTARAALVGGTVSVLGGGKFANGAQTGAFQYLFNARMTGKALARLAAKGSQLLSDYLIDAGAEKIHDNLHMRVAGVHSVADGVFKFNDVNFFHVAEVKLDDGDFTKNQQVVYPALKAGQQIEMWGTGADKIAARLGLTADASGVYKVPAGKLQIEVFAFTRSTGTHNEARSKILNDALKKGVNARGGMD
jgi:hypothetical protein